MKPPKVIYLIPATTDSDSDDYEWCIHDGINPQDAIQYIRTDDIKENVCECGKPKDVVYCGKCKKVWGVY